MIQKFLLTFKPIFLSRSIFQSYSTDHSQDITLMESTHRSCVDFPSLSVLLCVGSVYTCLNFYFKVTLNLKKKLKE